MTDIPIPNEIIPTIYNDVAHPAASEVGKILAVPFQAMNFCVDVAKEYSIAKLSNTKLLGEAVQKALEHNHVPPDRMTKPPTEVTIPVLQANSYTTSEDLRRLYANLLARAIDMDTSASAHPSFVEIIKQMSPAEARFAKETAVLMYNTPITRIACQDKPARPTFQKIDGTSHLASFTSGNILYNHYYITKFNAEREEITFMIDDFVRMHLISVSYEQHMSSPEVYKYYTTQDLNHIVVDSREENQVVVYNPGVVEPTEYGRAFYNICVS